MTEDSSSNKKIIEWLNIVLGRELTAINQYFLQYRLLEHLGLEKMAQKFRAESIEEMEHADVIMKRIIVLDELPKISGSNPIKVNKDLHKLLEQNLEMEKETVVTYRQAIKAIDKEGDIVTVDILTDILKSEEEHVEWVKQQLNLIKTIGIQNYAQSNALAN